MMMRHRAVLALTGALFAATPSARAQDADAGDDAQVDDAGEAPPEETDCPATLDHAGLPVCWERDHDGDGLWSLFEASPQFQVDTDGDHTPDFLDDDDDGDGVLTRDEQADPNGDGNPEDAVLTVSDLNAPDYLSADDDADSLATRDERPDGHDRDTDSDGVPDHHDQDDDGDGIPTRAELYDRVTGEMLDSNMDGVPDYLEKSPSSGAMDAGMALSDAGSAQLDAGVTDASTPRDAHAGGAEAGSAARDGGEQDAETESDASQDEGDDTIDDAPLAGHSGGGCGVPARGAGAGAAWPLLALTLGALWVRRRAR